MNKVISLIFFLATCVCGTALAQTKLVYVNGIQVVTRTKARDDAKEMAKILNESSTRSGTAKRTFDYEYVYNPIGFFGSTDGCDLCQDKKELLILKTAEELYFSDFQKILAPHNASSYLDQGAARQIKNKYVDDLTPGSSTNSLEKNGDITDADLAATKKAISGIIDKLRQSKGVFVGHSQGNLLLNLAWAAYVAEKGQSAQLGIKFVNVANTSRFAISGLNLTHDQDGALFSDAFGLVDLPRDFVNYSRTTPECPNNGVCKFILAPSTFGGRARAGDQPLEHYFINTYLSTIELPNVLVSQGVQYTSGKTRFRDRFEDLVYAAADSIDPPIKEPIKYFESVSGDLPEFGVASPPWFTPFGLKKGANTFSGRMSSSDFDAISFYVPAGLKAASVVLEISVNETPFDFSVTLLRRDPVTGFPYNTQQTLIFESHSTTALNSTHPLLVPIMPLSSLGVAHYVLGISSFSGSLTSLLRIDYKVTIQVDSAP